MAGQSGSIGRGRRWPTALRRLAGLALLAAGLAGCVVVPAGPYYPHRPCCFYSHPDRW